MQPDLHENALSAKKWLSYAKSDLAYSKVPRPPGGMLETLCFHAQQAAEKSIKAVLIYCGVPIKKTHNLRTLLTLLPDNMNAPDEIEESTILTDYAVITRYPGEYEELTPEDYQEAVNLATAVVRWAEQILGAEQLSP